MCIKMIVTDLDGTFYHKDLSYDKKRFDMLYQKMKDRDIRFVVASGNQYYQLISFFDNPNEISFIAENGGYIVENNQEIFSVSIKEGTYLSIINLLKDMTTIKVMIVCGKKSAYILSSTPDDICRCYQQYFPKMQKVHHFDDIDDQIIKISLVADEEDVNKVVKQMNNNIDDSLSIVTSGHGCIDLIVSGINKAKAIEILMEKWDIQVDEIMAFGDEMNDLEMLKLVKYGFVMANGSDVLKQQIGRVTPLTNEQDGELSIIEEYFHDPKQFCIKYHK